MVSKVSGTDGIRYPMPTLPSAYIVSVSYRPREPSKILATEYPRLNWSANIVSVSYRPRVPSKVLATEYPRLNFFSPGLTLRTAGHRIIRSGSRRSTSEHENSINQQNKPHRFAANHSSVLILWHAPTFFQLFSKWKKNEKTFFFSNGNSIYLPCSSFSWFRILKFFFIFHVFVVGVSDDF
jgi:hypothetical protein